MKEVPSSSYDEKYYSSICSGFEAFNKDKGYSLRDDQRVAFNLAKVKNGSSVLDMGCGRGEFLYNLTKKYRISATAIDYSKASVKISKRLFAKKKNINVMRMNATKLKFKDKQYDCIFMLDLVEHLYPKQLKKAISEAMRVLKPSGRLIIHTKPNKFFFDFTCRIQFFIKIILHSIINLFYSKKYPIPSWNPRPIHDKKYHVNEQTPYSLYKLLSGYDLKFKIIMYHPVNVSKRNFMLKILTDFYPFYKCWPFKYFFCNSIFVLIEKN